MVSYYFVKTYKLNLCPHKYNKYSQCIVYTHDKTIVLFFQAADQLDVLADQAAQDLTHGFHHRVEIQDSRLQNLLAAEGEQMAGEQRGLVGGPFNFFGVVAHRAAGFEVLQESRSVSKQHPGALKAMRCPGLHPFEGSSACHCAEKNQHHSL